MDKKNKIIITLLLTILHTITTFFTDQLFFHYKSGILFWLKLFTIKFILIILLFIFYYKLIEFIKEKKYKSKFFKIFIVNFIISMIMFTLVYPGVFRNDEIGIILYSSNFEIESWHHIITSAIYIIMLMIIPFSIGILIELNFIYSIIIAYLINKISNYLNLNKFYYYIILIIPFLLPPVLNNNFYPLRPIIYGYVELFTLFYLLFLFIDEQKISFFKLILLLISSVLLITWRSESILFIILIILSIIIYYKKNLISKKYLFIVTFSILLSVLFINKLNNYYLEKQYNNAYKVTMSYGFIQNSINYAIEENDNKTINAFNKILDVNGIKNNPDLWIGSFRKSYATSDETSQFLKAYIISIIKHPIEFINNRFQYFIKTNGFIKNVPVSIFSSYQLFDKNKGDNNNYVYELIKKIDDKSLKPININLRKKVIMFLEGINNDGTKNEFINLFWNSTIGITTILACFIYSLIKKKWFISLIVFFTLLKFVLVFLTSPDTFFMYYFSEYLIGNFIIAIFIVYFIKSTKKKVI